jgi:hypothetical protein
MKMKKLLMVFFLGLSSIFTLVANAQEANWTHANNEATICNRTSTTFHFIKTYSYQANTNDDHSADFILPPGSADSEPVADLTLLPNNCTNVDYWLQYQGNANDKDDDLEFTDQQQRAGSFHIKGERSNFAGVLISTVTQFNMPGFDVHILQSGKWVTGQKTQNLEFDIVKV